MVDCIARSTGTTHAQAKAVIQEFFTEIVSELAQGKRLEFRDFGVFAAKTTPARMARNPKTLKTVRVPAKRRVVFKMGRLMREGLNKDGLAAPVKRS